MCFIGKRKFNHFIDQYLEPASGNFVDVDSGEVVGGHTGVWHFTIGQNVAIGGSRERYFVSALDHRNQIVSVV